MGEKVRNPKSKAAKIASSPEAPRPAKARAAAKPGKTSRRAKALGERSLMSARELANLGGGSVAYIKVMSHDEAKAMFPAVEGLPDGINLYALHAADGTPLALADSRQAAVGQALGNELAIASLH